MPKVSDDEPEAPRDDDAGDEADEGAREEEEPSKQEAEPEPAPYATPLQAIAIAAGVTLATAAAITYAFDPARAGTGAMLGAMAIFYAPLAAITVARFHRRGELRELFRPAPGDLALAALTAGALYGAARVADLVIAGPGSLRQAWLMRLYLQLGDPRDPRRELIGGAVFLIAALEEIVWRGLVMRALAAAIGSTRALVVSSALFALAHASTLFLLRDPAAGLNPLVVAAAFGCSVVWGGMVLRARRYFPAICAHALFSWAIFEFPIWRP